MLLPSALDCAPGIQPMRSIYTTNAVLSPPPSHRQSTNSPANILSTCRALQSLITTNLTPPHITAKPSCAQPSLASPIVLAPTNHPHSTKSAPAPRSHTINTAPHPQPQPPTTKKRRRSPSTSDNHPPRTQNRATTTAPSTPKRQRLHPPTLPLGLSRADYATLQTQAAAIPIPSTPPTHPSNTTPSPSPLPLPSANTALSPPTTTLLTLILQNLRLHPHDWDECAQGHDSIDARFDFLLGSREVRLRRGRGRGGRGRGRKSVREVEFGMG